LLHTARSSIEATLAAGTAVVCDRYAFSGVAFSSGKGLSYEWCRAPEMGLPAPDATLFLDIDPTVAALTRGGFGAERYEREDLQTRVRSAFQRIRKEMGEQWITLDAAQPMERVAEMVWSEVQKLLTSPRGPIEKLWVA
jgi:dTMP kinase